MRDLERRDEHSQTEHAQQFHWGDRESRERFGPSFDDQGYRQGRFAVPNQYGARGYVSGDESSLKYRESGSYYSQAQPRLVSGSPQFVDKGPRGYVRSDERIREEIQERLANGYIDASDVEVAVQNGEVTLTGSVVDRRTRRMAEELLDPIRGIKDVTNRIRAKSAW